MQAQPGVERAMVLERATGRGVAPASLGGRAFASLPGVGEAWRDLTSPRVGRVDVVSRMPTCRPPTAPTSSGCATSGRRPTTPASRSWCPGRDTRLRDADRPAHQAAHEGDTAALHATGGTRPCPGASPKVMQGTLMPGLERLPGVVTYLLEQRRAGGAMPAGGHAAGSTDADESRAAGASRRRSIPARRGSR